MAKPKKRHLNEMTVTFAEVHYTPDGAPYVQTTVWRYETEASAGEIEEALENPEANFRLIEGGQMTNVT